jgi:hypothetical protein
VQPLWKTTWRPLKNLNIDLLYYPAIPIIRIYPKNLIPVTPEAPAYPCSALIIIAKLWNKRRCPTTDKWIMKLWYLYTMEFYPAMKKNEILSFTNKCMELESINLSEVSQAQKTKNRMFSIICRL